MGRLFWKIFLWFWLALALVNLAVGTGVKIYLEQTGHFGNEALQTQVSAIALAFEQGNFIKAKNLLVETSKQSKSPIFVLDERGRDILGRPLPPKVHFIRQNGSLENHRKLLYALTQLPNGRKLEVVAPKMHPPKGRLGGTPVWLALTITLLISTLVCYLLARYMSTPVRRLSRASHQLAQGNLDVRIDDTKRRDEIADLGKDFNLMASEIQSLLHTQKQLLQDVSHELRSPIARLRVALALARREVANKDQYLDRLDKDLDRLDSLVAEVLTLSQLNSVKHPKEDLNISQLTESIVKDCQFEAAQRDCVIKARIEPDVELYASPELLRRAIENIIRNALKFSPEKASIEVSLKSVESKIMIIVSDEGPGIPEDQTSKLFDPFVRLDSARGHAPGGYGLGLSIAKKAIEIHQGSISMENREQRGLRVLIELPTR